jgi:hypothetical protein
MSANDGLERGIADVFERDAPTRAPDWVLTSALETIESTPQRRVLIRVPWRLPEMNSLAKVAVAAAVVLAIGLVSLNLLSPRDRSAVGGQPIASPSPSSSGSPSASPSSSVAPSLSKTFTSMIHGLSIGYPGSWSLSPATQPWSGINQLDFESAEADHIYDPALRDHLFMAMASHPLDGIAGATWVTQFLDAPEEGCGTTQRESITVDGAKGQICGTLAAFSVADRAYYVRLYSSADESWLATIYDETWFRTILDTVKLDPTSAVSPSPSA